MSHHIPIPAPVSIAMNGLNYGSFDIYPEARRGPDGLEIIGWTTKDRDGVDRKLYDILAQSVLPRSLMNEVCRQTFERDDNPSVSVIFEVGGESWSLHMRAIEKEWETVHFEVEIDGEWMEMIETYVGDLINEDFFIFAENEVRPSVDFGSQHAVYEEMS